MVKKFDTQTLEFFKEGRSIQRELAGKLLNPKLTTEQKLDLQRSYGLIKNEIKDLKRKYYEQSDSTLRTKAESYISLLKAYDVNKIGKVR